MLPHVDTQELRHTSICWLRVVWDSLVCHGRGHRHMLARRRPLFVYLGAMRWRSFSGAPGSRLARAGRTTLPPIKGTRWAYFECNIAAAWAVDRPPPQRGAAFCVGCEHWAYLSVETQEMRLVESQDICFVDTQSMCSAES